MEVDDVQTRTDAKVEQIVLINAGEIDRCEMGELIQSISKCDPKGYRYQSLICGGEKSEM